MKKKLLMGLMLFASPAFCQFGFPSIVWDPKTMTQVIQDVNQAVRLYALVQNTAAAFKSGSWQMAFQAATMDAAAGLAVASPNIDPTRVVQLSKAIRLANMAAQESYLVGVRPTTGNAALLSMLAMQQAQAIVQRDQMQGALNYQSQVKQYQAHDTSFTDATEISNWRVQQ